MINRILFCIVSILVVIVFQGSKNTFANNDLKENKLDLNVKRIKINTYNDFSNMNYIELMRGNYQGREPLGVELPANIELKIRQVNTKLNQDLTLDLFNDDRKNEMSFSIPRTGEWITVSSNNLSVPLIRKLSSEQIPEIEFVLKDEMKKLPIYKDGIDENKFFEEWDNLDSDFAFIESDLIQMLIPKLDKNFLKNMNDFSSIDDLFKFYKGMFNTYDRLLGLEKNSDKPLHNNVDTQYFVKADKNGVGAAFYNPSYIAQNSRSLSAYLSKNWIPLHEVGHGYEYNIKNKGLCLVDVFNNILAHTYESTYLSNDEGWLFNGNRLKRDLSMKNVRNNGSYDKASVDDKLGVFIYLLDFIGEDAFIKFNKLYREKYFCGDLKDKDAITIFNELLSEITGYNFREYFASYDIKSNNNIFEEEKYSKYKNFFILGDLITYETIAKSIKEEYGLKSIYSLISTEDILKSTIDINDATIDFRISKDMFDEKKIIQLKDGNNVLKEIQLNNMDNKFINIKPGRYTFSIVDNKNSSDNYTFVKTIDIRSGHNIVNINLQKILNQKIIFKGLGDKVFAELDIDLSNSNIKLKTNSGKPHSYYSSCYAKIEIINKSNEVIFSKNYIGNKDEIFSEKIIDIQPGFKVNIYHEETFNRYNPKIESGRLSILNFYNQKSNYSLNKKNKFNITELGLDNNTLNLKNNLENLNKIYVNKINSELNENINYKIIKKELEKVINEKINLNGRTLESIKNYRDTIFFGKKILNDDNSTEEDIENAIKNIQDSKSKLIFAQINSVVKEVYWKENVLVLGGIFDLYGTNIDKNSKKILIIKDKNNKVIKEISTWNTLWNSHTGYQCYIDINELEELKKDKYKLFITIEIDGIKYEKSILNEEINNNYLDKLEVCRVKDSIIKFYIDKYNDIAFSKLELNKLKPKVKCKTLYFNKDGLVIDGIFGFNNYELNEFLKIKLVIKDLEGNIVNKIHTWNANWGEKNTGFQGILTNDILLKLIKGNYNLYVQSRYNGIDYDIKLTTDSKYFINNIIDDLKFFVKSDNDAINLINYN